MAICGMGMGSLAGMLKAKGLEVCGSDQNVYPPMSDELGNQGIEIFSPFSADNIKRAKPDLVVVGNAITRTNPEADYLLASQIPYVSMPQALQLFFFEDKEVIVVTGTHGKTTTTAIMSHLLTELGQDPSFLVGGVAKNQKRNFRLGSGKYFVIEGDEYDTAFFEKTPKFLHYQPCHVIATSLEFDHADIYENVGQIEDAFSKLFDLIPRDGSLHFCSAFPRLEPLIRSKMGKISYFIRRYGTDAVSWQIANYQALGGGSAFDLCVNGRTLLTITSPMTGLYNAQNVVACFSVLEHLGFGLPQAVEALQRFEGVKRRQEELYADEEWIVVDDFAHHPTAVSETIQAIKEKYPHRELVALFEPRSNTTRRNIFLHEYIQAFLLADQVYLAPVHQPEKVPEGQALDVVAIISQLCEHGIRAEGPLSCDAIINKVLEQHTQPSVVLIMTNGSFDGLGEKLVARLGHENTKTRGMKGKFNRAMSNRQLL